MRGAGGASPRRSHAALPDLPPRLRWLPCAAARRLLFRPQPGPPAASPACVLTNAGPPTLQVRGAACCAAELLRAPGAQAAGQPGAGRQPSAVDGRPVSAVPVAAGGRTHAADGASLAQAAAQQSKPEVLERMQGAGVAKPRHCPDCPPPAARLRDRRLLVAQFTERARPPCACRRLSITQGSVCSRRLANFRTSFPKVTRPASPQRVCNRS